MGALYRLSHLAHYQSLTHYGATIMDTAISNRHYARPPILPGGPQICTCGRKWPCPYYVAKHSRKVGRIRKILNARLKARG